MRAGNSASRLAAAVASSDAVARGIHHLDLVVPDVELSTRFYTELLHGLGWFGVLDLQGERGETI